jgi:hypothetical protein
MITVGLIRELHFIACMTGRVVLIDFQLGTDGNKLQLEVNENTLFVYYFNNKIWEETLSGADSGFGIESCDNISRIVSCIDTGDASWEEKYKYIQNNS